MVKRLWRRILEALGLGPRKKTIYEARYEAIGRATTAELQRNRNFRRDVARLPLGPKILRIVDNGLTEPENPKKRKK